MRTLIASDIHLGAHHNRAAEFVKFLNQPFDRIILNGDTVDHCNLHRFSDADWAVIRRLRQVSTSLTLIRGNHDHKGLEELLGVIAVDQRVVRVGHQAYLVLHGHKYDKTLTMTRVADVVDWLYCSLQFCLPDAAHALKVVSKGWLGTVAAVRAGALKEARTFGFGGVICGHTHYREDLTVDGVRYINTGCWMGKETTWIEIIDGELTCHHVEAK